MQKLTRQILKEALWLTLSLVLSVLLSLFLFGKTFLSGDLDLHIHDTYFVIPSWLILTPLFLFVAFIFYFIRTFKNKFNTKLPNWVLVISGIILLISLTILIKTFPQFSIRGWSVYPPLSALGPDKFLEMT